MLSRPFFGGLLIKRLSASKTASRRELELAKAGTSEAEANYIQEPTPDSQLKWLSSQRRLNELLEARPRNKPFFQKRLIWAEGEVKSC